MEKKINYAFVGLFIILLGSAWLAISLWLALGDFAIQYRTYRVYINESVSGLYLDAPVKYRGVEIGKVRDIDLNPDVPGQVQLTLDIEADVPIKEDTVAVLTVQGLTGIAFVDLTGGSVDSPLLVKQKGKDYPVITSAPSFFSRLDTSGTQLMAKLDTIANGLMEVLDAKGRENISQILVNVRDVTDAFANRKEELEQGVADASQMLHHGAEAAEQLTMLLGQVDETARAFEAMAVKLSAAGNSINQYVQSSGAGVEGFSQQTLPELGALISELRRVADTLHSVGRKLEADPRVLLYGRDLEAPGPGE